MSTSLTSFAFLVSSLVFGVAAVGCAEPEPVAGSASALTTDDTVEQGTGADSVTHCHGTEPFWGITIDPKKVTFNAVAMEESRSMINHGPKAAHGFTSTYAALYQGTLIEDPQKVLNVIITHADGGCSDGMSDEVYPFTVSVVSGSEFFSGCCASPKK
jgi:uncharacterized membrane protein